MATDVTPLHWLSAQAKRLLPQRAFSLARSLGNLALTPLLFSYYTGHARSALHNRPVDRLGRPVTWYTLPMNDLLSGKDFSRFHILELGGGQSTLWWAARAEKVVCLEADAAWYELLRPQVPGNVELHLCMDLPTLDHAIHHRRFDLIIIDGLDIPEVGRLRAALLSQEWLSPGGAILLDNSEGPWSEDGRFLIMDHFRHLGFQRVDFYGFCPGNLIPACTSIFFAPGTPCSLFTGTENPAIPYPIHQPGAASR